MNNFRLICRYPEYSDFTELEISDEVNISLNYQIEDIADISKRNTSFSKTITLPGTPVNNLFFRSVFDVNVNNITFNPAKRVPVFAVVDDNEVFTGDLQLLNIKLYNGEVEYEVIITGKLRDILTEMGDLNLRGLDLSEYDHVRNAQNIQDSWEYKVFINGQLTNVGGPGTGYVYPLIRREVHPIPALTVGFKDYELFPAVYLKTIIDKIFQTTNYTYTSNFFNSEYFKKLIVPFVEDKFTLSEEEYNDKMVYVGVDPSQGEAPDNPVNTGYVAITGPLFRNSVWYSNTNFNFDFNLNRFSGLLGAIDEAPFQFQNPNGSWGQFNGWDCTENGYYDISLRLRAFPKWFINVSCPFKYTGTGNFYFRYGLGRVPPSLIGSGNYFNLANSGTIPFSPSDDLQHNTPWYDLQTPLLMNAVAENVFVQEGDQIIVWFEVVYPINDFDGNETDWDSGTPCFTSVSASDVRMRIVLDQIYESGTNIRSRLKISKTTSQTYGQETGFMNQVLPDIKMSDFFLDVIKMFNLIVVDDKTNQNNLIIEPRDDYYASKQKVLDWEGEKKLDYDSEIKITPMSELDAKNYKYTYTKDSDWLNKEYEDETQKIWGELEVSVENDFSVKTNTTELLFAPTPVSNHNYSSTLGNYVMPYFTEYDGVTFKPKVVKPRILFYNGLLNLPSPTNSWIFRDTSTSGVLATLLNAFPYCGMWDNPTNPTFDLGFGRTEKIYWESQQFPLQNLYEKFHKATLNNIIDPNAKLFEGYFYLTPKDIAEFDFRDIVFLEGQYWRVNKIIDYNPIGKDELTKVELYLISDIKTYTPDRVKITTSNDQCPIDMVARRYKGGFYYVSKSGQPITEGCCNQLNGQWIDGVCKVRVVDGSFEPGPVGPLEPSPTGPINDTFTPIRFKSGGPFITPINQKSGPSSNTYLGNSKNGPGLILGSNNFGSGGNVVIGSNNTIGPDISNALIVGDNVYVDGNGVIYLGDGYITKDGEFVKTKSYLIDGTEDEVMAVMKTNLIDVVDGTEDAIRNFGGDSKERPIIDGNITLSINTNQPPELP